MGDLEQGPGVDVDASRTSLSWLPTWSMKLSTSCRCVSVVEVALDDAARRGRSRAAATSARSSAMARSVRDVGLAARCRISTASASARAMSSRRTSSAACRASSMMRPASLRASAICSRYCARAASASTRAFSALSRSLRMRSSRAAPCCLTGGHAPLPHRGRAAPRTRAAPDDLVVLGLQRGRRLLAVVDRLALLEELDALLRRRGSGFVVWRRATPRHARRTDHEPRRRHQRRASRVRTDPSVSRR